jgi:hypothetical protein
MGVLDRVNRNRRTTTTAQETEASPKGSASSTLIRREAPVIWRLKNVFTALQRFIESNGDSGLSRLSFLMTTFMDELAEELGEKDEVAMSVYMAQIGEVIAWIGHGDNSRLSPELRVFAEAMQPSAGNTENDVFMAERDSGREHPSERNTWNSRALASTSET